MKKGIFLTFIFLSVLNNLISQEVIIGKEEFLIVISDIPIRTGYGYDFNYNQMIYKQQWIHAEGEIEKIAFYYSGGTSVTFDIVVYMGHTQKKAFHNNEDWIQIEDLTVVFDGQYTVSDTLGWAEIILQVPFDYNNTDNLVIAIDRNSETETDGRFYSSVIDDDKVTRKTYSEYYNIDPANPIYYDCIDITNFTPRLKISGNLSLSDYLYIYGTKYLDISTTPNSQKTIPIETNLTSLSGYSNQEWLNVNTDSLNQNFTVTVNTENGTLNVERRVAQVSLSNSTFSDTTWFTQYKYEPFFIGDRSYLFCDYDNDLDLDIIGQYPDFSINDGFGIFSTVTEEYPVGGSSFWGDYDNDGDFDFLLLGDSYEECFTNILRNNDTTFSVINSDILPFRSWFSSYSACIMPWCDYDNDGDKDVLVIGIDSLNNSKTILYENLGNDKFEDSDINLQGANSGAASWGDYNNDGYTDLFIRGQDINGNSKKSIYKNNNDGGFDLIDFNLNGTEHSSIDWGDFDADGDLDLLLSEHIDEIGYVLKIFINDGNDIFTGLNNNVDTIFPFVSKWIDLNNDGKLDIVAFDVNDIDKALNIYINEGSNNFSKSSKHINISYFTVISIGNYDNDGDIDFLLRGLYDESTYCFRNNSNVINSKPSVPVGLKAIRKGSAFYLTWDRSNDAETPQKSLSYNVRIGSYPGEQDIMAPHSDLSTGFIKFPGLGNASIDTFKIIENLPLGTYYWSVQSIDFIYAGSEFSEEQSFDVLPVFSRNDTIIPYWSRSTAKFGDYDNDGDYDLVICGTLSDASASMTKLFKNNNDSTFTEVSANLNGIIDGAIDFGDYNNDNFIDLLISGTNKTNQTVAYIYRNDGDDIFYLLDTIEISESLVKTIGCWADYDNDGDLDISLTCDLNTLIYRNNGNDTFTFQETASINISSRIAAIADYDNDYDIDIFLSGWNSGTFSGNILKNENDFLFSTIENCTKGLDNGTGDAGDYNNDGNIDLLLTGTDTLGFRNTLIYKNLGNNTFEEINTGVRYVSDGRASWGDFDNDNDLDVVIGGESGGVILKVYENKGNDKFEEIFNDTFDEFNWITGYTIWGDYNNDQNIDFIRNGILYSNNSNIGKTPPYAPQNLGPGIDGFNVAFSWDKLINTQSGDCYSYNLRVGTTSGGTEIVSPMADVVSGFRRILVMGNAQKNDSWVIKNLTPGETYYWSVQAIDNSFAGGAWAEEQSFVLNVVWADFLADTVCLGDTSHFTDISLYGENEINSWKWYFGDGDSAMIQHPNHLYSQSGSYPVTLIVSDGEYTGSTTKNIIVKPKPIVNFQVDAVCYGNPSVFANQTDEQELAISSWNWEFGDNQTSNIKNPEPHYYAQAGEYNVKLTVTSNNGCFDTISKPVIVAQYPVVIVTANGPIEFCEGDNVLLSVAENANYQYQWKLDDVPISDSINYHYSAIYKGAYSVDVENTLAGCLSTSSSVNVNVVEKPVKPIVSVSGFDPDNCPESELITLEVTDATSLYQYQWKRNGIPLGDGVNSTYEGYLTEGNYIVDVANGDCKATSDEVSIFYNIKLPEKPEIIAVGPNVWYLACTNDKAQQYEWYYNNEIISGANAYLYVANQTLGTYFVKIAEENGCFVSSDAVTIPLSATGIDDINPFAGLKIYPNPTPGMFTIEMDNQLYGELFIFIYTQEAKEVFNIKFYKNIQHFKTQIDLSGQGSGLYVILLSLDNYKTERKLIIE